MGLLLTTIAGLVVWIVLWAIGVKSFDAFLITLAMIVIAATARMLGPVLAGNRGEETRRTAVGTHANALVTQGRCVTSDAMNTIARSDQGSTL